MKERKRNVIISGVPLAAVCAVIICVIFVICVIWFNIPYSPLKKQFEKDISAIITENRLPAENGTFTEEDFSGLPDAVRRYAERCGYIGTRKMSCLRMEYRDVDFSQGREGPKLKIDYTQYDFVSEPCRMALIDSSMFGIPFEGYDYYRNGHGGMKGVIAKSITLFDQTGDDMDKACLATFLAESMFAPSILLRDYITFEEISGREVKATISYKGQTATGVFTFNDDYEMISFSTNDRAVTGTDGSAEYVPWSAVCEDYRLSQNGIRYPTKFKAVWNYPDGDFVYFDGIISEVSYGYGQ